MAALLNLGLVFVLQYESGVMIGTNSSLIRTHDPLLGFLDGHHFLMEMQNKAQKKWRNGKPTCRGSNPAPTK